MAIVGVVHPGAMGSVVGTALCGRGHEVLWASEGRGEESAARAAAAGMRDVGTVAALRSRADLALSIVRRLRRSRSQRHFRGSRAVRGHAVEAIVLDGGVGAASALKMTYAAWTKGTAALLVAIRETARTASTTSCWREIAATFAAAGQPDGFHLAAAEVFATAGERSGDGSRTTPAAERSSS